ncbi:MAG: C4-dicarboxylate TRAP transporter substrate-binding protein [Pseudomonadota bacterium]|nr:C4-dicarboxylate TRAP transporter substrate-binding protein [Pseudomonadota bacterium]
MEFKTTKGGLSRFTTAAAAGLALGALATTGAQAQTLRHAVGLPESSYNYDAAMAFADELAATSDIDVKVFAMSLLSLNEIPGGVRDGLADIGFTLFPYFPAEFSELNLPANLSLLATSGTEAKWPGPAMIGASMEYIMLECDDCKAQMKGLNGVYLNGGAAVEYGLVCNKPVETIADIQGLKVRTGAADVGRFIEYFGGTRVALSGNEIYDALSTGNVDCSANQGENLTGLRYIEVADHFTDMMPGSMFAGIANAIMNRDTWASLSEEQRRAVLNAAAMQPVVSWMIVKERNVEGIQAFRDAGKNVYEVSESDQALIAEFIAQDIDVVRAEFKDQYGLENVDEKIETIIALIEKWKGLTNQIEEMEEEAFTQLYIDEIMSKIDVATYGIE